MTAFLNQAVKKSGRTTGLTHSKITGLNATVSVTYDNECAGGAAFTKTFTGQIEQMKVQLGNIAENIGAGVIPAFQGMLAPIKAVSAGFAALPSGIQETIGSVAGIGVAASGAVGAVSLIAGKLEALKSIAMADPTAGLSGGLTTMGKVMGVAGIATAALGAAPVAEQSSAIYR